MPDVDVLVCGAGPAGAVAAWEAKQAARELDVVLLERDRAVGAPVRCAEGVGDAGLREFAAPDGADWVSRRIKDVIFQAPDDTEVVMANSGVGWILDRTRFDAYLAAEAARSGAAVLVGTEATGMGRNGARAGQRTWPGNDLSRARRHRRGRRRDDGGPLGGTRYARPVTRHGILRAIRAARHRLQS